MTPSPPNEIIFTSLQCHSIISSLYEGMFYMMEAFTAADQATNADVSYPLPILVKRITHNGRYTNPPLYMSHRALLPVAMCSVTRLPLQEPGQLSEHRKTLVETVCAEAR